MRDDSTTSARARLEFWMPTTNYRVYHAELGRIVGGLHEVIILEHLIDWARSAPDGWAYRTIEEIEEATLLTKSMQQAARQTLTESGILETERRGNPARNFYRIDYEVLERAIDASREVESDRISRTYTCDKSHPGVRQVAPIRATPPNTPKETLIEQVYTGEAPIENIVEVQTDYGRVRIVEAEDDDVAIPLDGQPIHERPIGVMGIVTHRPLWQAYCRGVGIDQRSPGYLAIEQKNRPHLASIDWASTVIDLEAFEATARYLVRRWEAGSVYATPNLAHVFEAMAEYERWLEAGSPPITRTKAPPLARGNTIPGDDYWRSMAEADMSEAEEILKRSTAERKAAREALALAELEQ